MFTRVTDGCLEGISLPITSTPFVRKSQPKPQGRLSVGNRKLTISVFDGLAMRPVTISAKDALVDLLEKVSKTLKRPNNSVQMVYEAPWSSKLNSKKCLAYVSSEEELDEFWMACVRYVAGGKGKKPKELLATDIVFRNMLDGAQASFTNHYY